MNPAQLIARKRDGLAMSADDIAALIRGYVAGEVPDYQMSAWAMAVAIGANKRTRPSAEIVVILFPF